MKVAVVKFDESLQSIQRAIELCGGLDKLDRHSRVLIKPNITFSGWMPIPLYGMVTSARVVEGVLYMLAEHGCTNISIGEGAISGVLGSNTTLGYRRTGIQEVAKKYRAKIVDFNEGPFIKIPMGNVKIGVSKWVLESDFIINIPVLKTHSLVKVSLGFKNLKGCIDYHSRRLFHKKGLEHMLALLNESINCDLTVIDGIYMLERGPDTILGIAHRKDLIIASCDTFSCDCVGATVMGIDPAQVCYLKEYAEAHNRPIDISSITILGENLKSLSTSVNWVSSVDDDLLGPAGITGLSVPHPGQGLCSGCYANIVFSVAVLAHDNHGRRVPDTTIYCGIKRINQPDNRRVMLYGDCSIKRNKGLNHAIRVSGCPPKTSSTLLFLIRTLLPKPVWLRMLLLGVPRLLAIRMGWYIQIIPHWRRYGSAEFDRAHFRPLDRTTQHSIHRTYVSTPTSRSL